MKHQWLRRIAVWALALVGTCGGVAGAAGVRDVVTSGNVPALKAILAKQQGQLKWKGTAGETPLHIAVLRNQTAVVDLLLARHAAVNAKRADGKTPLDVAGTDELRDRLRKAGGVTTDP